MGRPTKMTQAKRNRERALQMKRQEKAERRTQRKATNAEPVPILEGEDPDLIGLRPGPQFNDEY